MAGAPLRPVVSKAVVRKGRGAYSDHRWVSLMLASKVGNIESINVMPFRYDIDLQSGNLPCWPDAVQLVACSREEPHAGRIGPKIGVDGAGILLAPNRYFPALTRMKGRAPGLSLDGCFDTEQQLSTDFVNNFKALIKHLGQSEAVI